MAEYKELVLLRDSEGIPLLAVLPTGIAHPGYIANIGDEILVTVEDTEWIDVNSKKYDIIQQACDIVEVKAILNTVWTKEEETNGESV